MPAWKAAPGSAGGFHKQDRVTERCQVFVTGNAISRFNPRQSRGLTVDCKALPPV
jgi:hypothetical protein